jgi:hypothetical protein
MSKIEDIHVWEKAVVALYNIDGWNLKWSGGEFEHYDAKGYTPKGFPCVIEMKFRNEYYEDKLLEKYKYDKLMAMDDKIVKLYFVNDSRANYLFWLNNPKKKWEDITTIKQIWCPKTTLWNSQKVRKECYLINQKYSIITNLNSL